MKTGITETGVGSSLGRRLRLLNTVLAAVLTGVVLAYLASFREAVSAVAAPIVPTFRDLVVFEQDGNFAGRITLVNPLAEGVELLVEVDLYDGEHNVGELFEAMTLAPASECVLELSGYATYTAFTDSRVNLVGWQPEQA